VLLLPLLLALGACGNPPTPAPAQALAPAPVAEDIKALRIVQVGANLLTDTSNGSEWACTVETLVQEQVSVYRCTGPGTSLLGLRIVQVGEKLITSTSNGDAWACSIETVKPNTVALVVCATE